MSDEDFKRWVKRLDCAIKLYNLSCTWEKSLLNARITDREYQQFFDELRSKRDESISVLRNKVKINMKSIELTDRAAQWVEVQRDEECATVFENTLSKLIMGLAKHLDEPMAEELRLTEVITHLANYADLGIELAKTDD